ncbi:lysophospholipid acyltransferase family protein [Desulfococcus sp.]|uniref:lysophospholipid acyltransferase family protein n=1 Tax=Desulfococcus sp. TaxID=2025834 RepID=UPI003594120E
MAEPPPLAGAAWLGWGKPVIDILVTLAAWTYYTAGYVIFFAPAYLAAAQLSRDPETAFQRCNHRFYRVFFRLLRVITPGLAIEIGDEVRAIRGSVIVSNHVSYLDPILLISLYPRQKTIVKPVFFRVPIFGRVLRQSGYISPLLEDAADPAMIRQIERLGSYLDQGGNLFVFPEGTRARNGRILPFSRGAFKIARRCNAPMQVVFIRNTDRLFRPGRFRFITCVPNTVRVSLIGTIDPRQAPSVTALMDQVRALMEAECGKEAPAGAPSFSTP